jgi:hypothetical protein
MMEITVAMVATLGMASTIGQGTRRTKYSCGAIAQALHQGPEDGRANKWQLFYSSFAPPKTALESVGNARSNLL